MTVIRDSLIVSALLLSGVARVSAQGADDRPEGLGTDVPSLAAAQADDEDAPREGFTLSYGGAITSNYIDDGATQSNDNPALQGYVEGAYGLAYGGIWASTVDYPGEDDNLEFDFYAGIRPTLGQFQFDIAYYRYVYDSSGDCCGEFQLSVSSDIGENGEFEIEFDYDPETYEQWGEFGGGIAFAENWEASFSLGTDFGSGDETEGDDKVAIDAGVTRSIGDFTWIDLRYYNSNYDPETVVATLGVDF